MAYRDVILADTPVAYWRLGEASGTVAADERAVQAGTYVNAPTLAQPGALAGDANTAVGFNGTTQHVDVGDLKIGAQTDATVELWFKATTTGFTQYMYADGSTLGSTRLFGVVLHGGQVRVFWRNDANVSLDLRSPLAYNNGAWHHVVVTKVGTTVRIYVDGGEVISGTTSGGAITLDTSTIAAARRGASPDLWYAGTLDEVAVYNVALTAAKVAEHYQAGTTTGGISGTGSPLLGTVSATAAGKVDIAGQGAQTLAALASTGAAKVEVTGSGSPTLGTLASMGTGSGGGISGTGSPLLATLVGSSSGTVGGAIKDAAAEIPLSALATAMLRDLPPVLREDPSIRAALNVQAREAERGRSVLTRLRANFSPGSADELGLPWHEVTVGLPVEPLRPVTQRREAVLSVYRGVRREGSGEDWERVLAEVASGSSYREHVPGDPTSPPQYTVRVTVPYSATSDAFGRARLRLRAALPANTALELVSELGFVLDQGALDQEAFLF